MTNLAFGDGQVWTGRLPSWQNYAQGDIDNGSGLDLFMFRQYSNVQGRWISPDPAGMAAADPTNPQTWNRYGGWPTSPADPNVSELIIRGCPISRVFCEKWGLDRGKALAGLYATRTAILSTVQSLIRTDPISP